ncbi:MAG: hypothetical protein V4730_11990 [Pseudomonadota bacterium]
MSDELKAAAQAVLNQWDSPRWEWAEQGPTADLMARLRTALSTQPAAPHECKTEGEKTAFAFGWWKALEQARKTAVPLQPPAGCQLVPVEPTRAMEDAAIREMGWCPEDVAAAETDDDERIDLRVTYRAMLAAAPPLPSMDTVNSAASGSVQGVAFDDDVPIEHDPVLQLMGDRCQCRRCRMDRTSIASSGGKAE